MRPNDSRMWIALAACYEKIRRSVRPLHAFVCALADNLLLYRVPDAITAFQRALVTSEEGDYETAVRVGRLLNRLGDSLGAMQYHRRALDVALEVEAPKNELSKLWIWLARWEMRREREHRASTAAKAAGDDSASWPEEGDLEIAREWLGKAAEVLEDKEVSLFDMLRVLKPC